MSDVPQGADWWQASDLRWYPPETHPDRQATPPPAAPPTYGGPPQPWTTPGPGTGYGAVPAYGYGYGPPPLPSVQNQAVASLALGVLAVIPCCWPFNAVLGLIGLPLGIVAYRKITAGQAAPDGKGLAIAGIVTSAAAIALGIVLIVFVLGVEATAYGTIAPG